ncbi:MAG: hypothetical protein ACHQET_09435 [Chitinophagales bacterium]
MKIVKVVYSTKPEYAAQNQANIKAVMKDLQRLQYASVNYNACLSSDGKTFIHTAFYKSDEDQKLVTELPSFKHFQEQLRAEGLENPPKQELLTLVGSSADILKA